VRPGKPATRISQHLVPHFRALVHGEVNAFYSLPAQKYKEGIRIGPLARQVLLREYCNW
jgi:hypothetical protein